MGDAAQTLENSSPLDAGNFSFSLRVQPASCSWRFPSCGASAI
jgi:hypothetical protein